MSETENDELDDVVEPVTQWLTFLLEKEKYGVKVVQVQEVLRYTPIAAVPGAPKEVLGIINLRGNVVTVVDARVRFDMEPKEQDDLTRIMVMDVQGHIIGVLVDNVTGVIDIKDNMVESTPDVNNANGSLFVQGIANMNGELNILVNFDKLLDDEELELLAS